MTPTREKAKEAVERFLAIAEDLPDDEIAQLAVEANAEAAYYNQLAAAYNGEAVRRVNNRGATMIVTPQWIGEKTATKAYVWDLEMLEDNARPLIPAELWDTAVTIAPPPPPPPPVAKVDTVKMLALGKKLGLDLTPFYRVDETNPKVKWRERTEDKPLC